MNEKKIPAIRFQGFTDEWEHHKFGDIAKFINGRAYTQNELLPTGKYKVLRVGNFYTNESWYYSNLELAEKYYAEDGDLLYTWSATFGPHIWHGEKVIYHYHIWKVDVSDRLDKYFAMQLFEQDKHDILSGYNGSTMAHITKYGMEKKRVIIPPNIEEQKQLGIFLGKLDQLIALHQHKLTKLQLLKKSMLTKMFPKDGARVPEIRFQGFHGDWKERKLGEVMESYSGGTPSVGIKEYYGGDIPFIRSAEINSESTELFLTNAGLNNSSARLVSQGDILYALYGATSGEVGRARLSGAINQAILAIKPNNGYDSEYITQWL
ncbi:restriction endonuclease subunit S, partial [Selenomonas bovis]|uniref:restriction endonuclease subunit S n=1 Tax=Selenomonas bovis TaxID=416586 RepID=UPI003D004681